MDTSRVPHTSALDYDDFLREVKGRIGLFCAFEEEDAMGAKEWIYGRPAIEGMLEALRPRVENNDESLTFTAFEPFHRFRFLLTVAEVTMVEEWTAAFVERVGAAGVPVGLAPMAHVPEQVLPPAAQRVADDTQQLLHR